MQVRPVGVVLACFVAVSCERSGGNSSASDTRTGASTRTVSAYTDALVGKWKSEGGTLTVTRNLFTVTEENGAGHDAVTSTFEVVDSTHLRLNGDLTGAVPAQYGVWGDSLVLARSQGPVVFIRVR